MNGILKPELPEGTAFILNALNSDGYEAYIVGGCVRDMIMERTPADWDITTAAPPEKVKELFDKTIDTGLKHGTVTVIIGSGGYEVTTFRLDGRYTDSRHPESVEYTGSIEADLSRRDFTMNAIAWNPGKGFVDPFGGRNDIERKIVRTVGAADHRFSEDALRMLRAVRFSAQLGFDLDEETLRSIGANCQLIDRISSERIREELTRILVSENPLKFALLKDTGLLHHIMPEFERCFEVPQNHPYHIYNVADHCLHAVGAAENTPYLRWTMLLHDIGKPVTRTTDEKGIDHFYGHAAQGVTIADTILGRLRFDNVSKDRILRLVRLHDRQIAPAFKAVIKAIYAVGEDIFEDLLKVKAADKEAQNPEYSLEDLEDVRKIRRLYREIKEKGIALSFKDLAIDGNDLVNAGWPQGKEIGRVLRLLLERVIEDPGLNSRDKLLELSESLK